MKWKFKKGVFEANARVLFQGFHHKDVLEKNLDKDAPTLSRLRRNFIYYVCATMRWRLVAGDVKGAFMQTDGTLEERGIRLYGVPTGDMRRRLAKIMGLSSSQIMRWIKPPFGDCRSPILWNLTARRVMTIDAGFREHRMDSCLFMSFRMLQDEDPPMVLEIAFVEDDVTWVLDGIMGLHVDDYIGGGEGLNAIEDLSGAECSSEYFLGRVKIMDSKLKFGKWDFELEKIFCGTQVRQSASLCDIVVTNEEYIHRVRPISLEKNRRQDANDLLTDKEHSAFRGLIGALQWPATQTMVHGTASCSFLSAAFVSTL